MEDRANNCKDPNEIHPSIQTVSDTIPVTFHVFARMPDQRLSHYCPSPTSLSIPIPASCLRDQGLFMGHISIYLKPGHTHIAFSNLFKLGTEIVLVSFDKCTVFRCHVLAYPLRRSSKYTGVSRLLLRQIKYGLWLFSTVHTTVSTFDFKLSLAPVIGTSTPIF